MSRRTSPVPAPEFQVVSGIISHATLQSVNHLFKQLSDKNRYLSQHDLDYLHTAHHIEQEMLNFCVYCPHSEERRVIGMSFLVICRKIGESYGIVEDVVVERDYHRRGIASMMLRAIIEEGRCRNLTYLQLTNNPERGNAELYIKAGFYRAAKADKEVDKENKKYTDMYRLYF